MLQPFSLKLTLDAVRIYLAELEDGEKRSPDEHRHESGQDRRFGSCRQPTPLEKLCSFPMLVRLKRGIDCMMSGGPIRSPPAYLRAHFRRSGFLLAVLRMVIGVHAREECLVIAIQRGALNGSFIVSTVLESARLWLGPCCVTIARSSRRLSRYMTHYPTL